MTVTLYEPLSDEEIQAWRNCRFVTTNIERTHAIGCTNSPQTWAVMKQHVGSNLDAPSGQRDSRERTMEFEVRSTHPEIIALAVERAKMNPVRPKVWPWYEVPTGPFGRKAS